MCRSRVTRVGNGLLLQNSCLKIITCCCTTAGYTCRFGGNYFCIIGCKQQLLIHTNGNKPYDGIGTLIWFIPKLRFSAAISNVKILKGENSKFRLALIITKTVFTAVRHFTSIFNTSLMIKIAKNNMQIEWYYIPSHGWAKLLLYIICGKPFHLKLSNLL